MLGIKTERTLIRGEFAKKLREEIEIALSERKHRKDQKKSK